MVQRPRGNRRRLTDQLSHMLPIAVDAMGGDNAPSAILAGALEAAALGIPLLLVGPEGLEGTGDLPLLVASEVIEMDDDPAQSVRRKRDSTLVRAAEAVRDGKASAMISAGNTGATMASALLRMGRISGVARPAIATPVMRPIRNNALAMVAPVLPAEIIALALPSRTASAALTRVESRLRRTD